MQPAPKLAVGKLLRTLSTDYSSQSLALQPITDVHAAPMQQPAAPQQATQPAAATTATTSDVALQEPGDDLPF